MNTNKHLILCIDDDEDFLESMKLIIEGGGYDIEVANSAEAGLAKFKTRQPDLMIVDLMMEEVDSGVQLVKELRSMGSTPPIYLLSSVGDNLNTNIDYSQLGFTGVLQKPIDPAKLLSMLKAKLK